MTAPPSLSVVVPTEGRLSLLTDLLRSLSEARATYPGVNEVLIVDSSSREQADAIRAICSANDAIYIAGPQSVREKRNLGIASSSGEIVVFVDSDETVRPDFLTLHAEAYSGPEIGGAVGPVEFQGPTTWQWKTVAASRYLHPFALALRSDSPPWGPCANISYRRRALEEVGGFETDWPFKLGADDVDLSLRVRAAGWRLTSVPCAVAYHSNSTWLPLKRTASRGFRWGRMHVYLSDRHEPTVQELPAALLGAVIVFTGVVAAFFCLPTGAAVLPAGLGLLLSAVTPGSGIWGFVALPLDAVFDVGSLYEAVKTGRGVSVGLRRVSYSEGQRLWRRKAQQRHLCMFLAGACVGVLLLVMLW